jgi:hypothetical protein
MEKEPDKRENAKENEKKGQASPSPFLLTVWPCPPPPRTDLGLNPSKHSMQSKEGIERDPNDCFECGNKLRHRIPHLQNDSKKRDVCIFALHILKIPGRGRGCFGDPKKKPDGSLRYGTELAIFIFYDMMCNINDSYRDLTKYS